MKIKALCFGCFLLFTLPLYAGGIVEKPISDLVINYFQYSENIATGGALHEGAAIQLRLNGFHTVLDLRTEAEGTIAEQAELEAQGIVYRNLPMGRTLPDSKTIETFKSIVENPDSYPLLIHCASGNRVGTAWALYKIAEHGDVEAAIEEGRSMGMRDSRIQAIRDSLNQ